jgi:predicted dehydrogenase
MEQRLMEFGGRSMFNVGIMGAGKIAQKMAATLNDMDDAHAYAIASRDVERAQGFAGEHRIEKAYGSYERMLEDAAVDLVYIATPHSHHFEHIHLCLEYGKPVLCEKAFTINARQAHDVIAEAKDKKLLLAEAIWTRYLPMRKIIDQTIASGAIGSVHSLTANLGHLVSHIPRLYDPSLAGGSLLDMGVYPLNFALMCFGNDIDSIISTAELSDLGVDLQNAVMLMYTDGRIAQLHSSQIGLTDRRGMLYGSEGFLEVVNINNPEKIIIYNTDYTVREEIERPAQITGFEYQVRSCMKAIEEGVIECPEQPHGEIIRVMEIMDAIRTQWGMRYPME